MGRRRDWRRRGRDVNVVGAGARCEARVVHEEALASRKATAATVDVAGDLLGSSEVLGRVEEVTLLHGVAGAGAEVRARLQLLGRSDFRAELGLALANVLALAAEGGIAGLAGLCFGAAGSVVCVAAAQLLKQVAWVARAEGTVARLAAEAELARDCIVFRDLVEKRLGLAVPFARASFDGEVHWPRIVEELSGWIDRASADVDNALIARGAQVGDGGADTVDNQQSCVLQGSADVFGFDPVEFPLVPQLEHEVESLAVSKLTVEAVIEPWSDIDPVAGQFAGNGDILSCKYDLAFERLRDGRDLVVSIERFPRAKVTQRLDAAFRERIHISFNATLTKGFEYINELNFLSCRRVGFDL